MEKIIKSRLVFYLALEMIRAGRAFCAKDAYAAWPQDSVPTSFNSVKVAFTRMKMRGLTACNRSQCVLTAKGLATAMEAREPLRMAIEEHVRLADYKTLEQVFLLWGGK